MTTTHLKVAAASSSSSSSSSRMMDTGVLGEVERGEELLLTITLLEELGGAWSFSSWSLTWAGVAGEELRLPITLLEELFSDRLLSSSCLSCSSTRGGERGEEPLLTITILEEGGGVGDSLSLLTSESEGAWPEVGIKMGAE